MDKTVQLAKVAFQQVNVKLEIAVHTHSIPLLTVHLNQEVWADLHKEEWADLNKEVWADHNKWAAPDQVSKDLHHKEDKLDQTPLDQGNFHHASINSECALQTLMDFSTLHHITTEHQGKESI